MPQELCHATMPYRLAVVLVVLCGSANAVVPCRNAVSLNITSMLTIVLMSYGMLPCHCASLCDIVLSFVLLCHAVLSYAMLACYAAV